MYICQVNKDDLRAKRKALKITQEELGNRLGVAGNTVERGLVPMPPFLELAMLAIENNFVIKNILEKATENGGTITEDELINELNKIPDFWKNAKIEEMAREKKLINID